MGRHAKKKDTKRQIATATIIAAGGAVLYPTTANAATVNDWDRVAECESGNRWNLSWGDRDSTGGLQFRVASWGAALQYLSTHGVDTSGYPSMPYQATKQQQITAGEALLALQGPGAWTCNAMVGSPLASAGPHGSMFEGGINPYPGNSGNARKAAPPPPPKPKPTTPATSHTVVPGDTLYGISLRHLGDGYQWPKLFRANKHKIDDPDLIYPGQVFTIPGGKAAPAKPKPKPKPPASPPVGKVLPIDGVSTTTNPCGAGRAGYSLGYHTGVDYTAPQGTAVRAALAGTVIASDGSSAYGINVLIRHADGTYTLYAHLSAKLVVAGQAVGGGQLIGRVGSTGASSGPHLHFEVRTSPTFAQGVFLNPQAWLNGVRQACG